MNIVQKSRAVKLSIGLIAASAVSLPLTATAATLYVSDFGSGSIKKISSTGTVMNFAMGVNSPGGLAFDGSGNLFVANYFSNSINQISSTGTVTNFVTTGLNNPTGLAFDGSGNLFEADTSSNSIKQISSAGAVTTFATGLNRPAFLAFGPDPVSTAVPEPFTIIGTLVGGTAALRMRKKLKSSGKV